MESGDAAILGHYFVAKDQLSRHGNFQQNQWVILLIFVPSAEKSGSSPFDEIRFPIVNLPGQSSAASTCRPSIYVAGKKACDR